MGLMCHTLQIPDAPDVLTARTQRLLRRGEYERKEALALRKLVHPGDRVLELGGGLGIISALALKLGAGSVFVVEANAELHGQINAVHACNDLEGGTVWHGIAAVQDGPDQPFYVRRNMLASSLDPDPKIGTVLRQENVPQLGLRGLLHRAKPDVLVCDIEGAETEVLPSADLSSLRAAIVELHPQWIGPKGVNKVFDAFARAGLTYCARASQGKVVGFERFA